MPIYLLLKAEALHLALADCTSEALQAINEAQTLAERFEQGCVFSGLHRLRGVFLATLGAEENRIKASFFEAIRTAKEQKSVLLAKTRRSNLRGISQAKSERIRRTWVPITSLDGMDRRDCASHALRLLMAEESSSRRKRHRRARRLSRQGRWQTRVRRSGFQCIWSIRSP